MALCNAHYYATRDPLGTAGDFITAPEISQMFGELVGLWCADLWLRAGSPDVAWVELGPGRGTLAADAVRAMAKAGLAPPVHFVETSPTLRVAQTARVPGAVHHDSIASLPADRPLIVVANEFFDALPIRQLVRTADGWGERMVGVANGRLIPAHGGELPINSPLSSGERGFGAMHRSTQ
jgi:NADH dehydrogenase [ubiquinone] 1 alpha subcomplex assembly factor 7